LFLFGDEKDSMGRTETLGLLDRDTRFDGSNGEIARLLKGLLETERDTGLEGFWFRDNGFI
jgi:hypothetical protein